MADLSAGSVTIGITATTNVPAVAASASAALGATGKAAAQTGQAAKAFGQQLDGMAKSMLIANGVSHTLGAAMSGNVAGALMSLAPLLASVAGGVKALGAQLLALAMNPIVLALAALTALVAGTIKAVGAYRDAQHASRDLIDHTDKLQRALTALTPERVAAETKKLGEEFVRTGEFTTSMETRVLRLSRAVSNAGGDIESFGRSMTASGIMAEKLGVQTEEEIAVLERQRAALVADHEAGVTTRDEFNRLAAALEAQVPPLAEATRAWTFHGASIRAVRGEVTDLLAVAGGGAGSISKLLEETGAPGDLSAAGVIGEAQGPAPETRETERRHAREAAEVASRNRLIDGEAAYQDRLYAIEESGFQARSDLLADFVSGSANVMGGFFEDLVSGSDRGGKATLANFLSMVGSMAIQLGTFGLLSAALLTAIPFFSLSGGAAAAAGVALIAFGGALKGAAALISQGANTAGGGAARGPLTGSVERTTGVRRPGEGGAGAAVNVSVTVQGALATRDEIALAVAEGVDRAASLGYRSRRAA